jgi:outer membrane receptor protein involved in Fe transport
MNRRKLCLPTIKKKCQLVVMFLVVVGFGFFVCGRSQAQEGGATLSGTVTDPSGAVVPGASVSVKNTATSVTRNVATDSAGFYSVPNLLPGKYDVTGSGTGFSTLVQAGIVLGVGDSQILNLSLKVGQATQSVVVAATTPAVQLATSDITSGVEESTIRELPLNGRDWTQLATLEPGVTSTNSIQAGAGTILRITRGFGTTLTISGARPEQNSYRIDGINVNNYVNGSPGSVTGGALGVDALQEFSVVTSNYSAEYGRTSGGVVDAVTKPGSNQLHGSAYEFVRNSALDARNYFDGPQIPDFERNQFGASAGGPIQKNRTFIFGDYEGIRQNLGVTTLSDVPSLDARNGILHNADGSTTTITVDPNVVPFLAAWPVPNGPILAPGNTAIFTLVSQDVVSENFYSARADRTISAKDGLFASWQYDTSSTSTPDALDNVQFPGHTTRVLAAIGENHVFSSQLVNSFRVGYNRSTASTFGFTPISPLATDPSLAAVPGQFAPVISVAGLTLFQGGLNATSAESHVFNAYQAYDDLTLIKGNHSLKLGFAVERDQVQGLKRTNPGGEFVFNTLTNFLTNKAKSFTGPNSTFPDTPRNYRQTILAGYVQDDVRWRPNLTLNLGLRYEMSTLPTEVNNKLTNLVNVTDAEPRLGAPLFSNPTYRNFEPRLGFAWDPFRNGKTAIRGGFGIYDALPLIYEYGTLDALDAPFSNTAQVQPAPAGVFPAGAYPLLVGKNLGLKYFHIDPNPPRNYVMQWNLNIQHQLTPNLAASVAYVGSRSVHVAQSSSDANFVVPTVTTSGFLWPSPIGSGTVQNTNPNVGRIDYLDWGTEANYNALQAQITKKFSHGFQAQASYTWAKSLDEGSSIETSNSFLNSVVIPMYLFPKLRYGLSDYSVGHTLTLYSYWLVPTPQSLREGSAGWVFRGWQLGGILTAQSGLPFTPIIGGDPLGMNSTDTTDYPDRLKGPGCGTAVNPGNANDYIKLNCFTLPVSTPAIAAQCVPFQPGGAGNPVIAGTCSNLLGNEGRNSVIGPGLVNLDFSLFKNNRVQRISENFNVQFRAEFFNLFNRSNFNAPIDNSTIFNQDGSPVGGAGLIDSTSTTAREIQFGIKVIW